MELDALNPDEFADAVALQLRQRVPSFNREGYKLDMVVEMKHLVEDAKQHQVPLAPGEKPAKEFMEWIPYHRWRPAKKELPKKEFMEWIPYHRWRPEH